MAALAFDTLWLWLARFFADAVCTHRIQNMKYVRSMLEACIMSIKCMDIHPFVMPLLNALMISITCACSRCVFRCQPTGHRAHEWNIFSQFGLLGQK